MATGARPTSVAPLAGFAWLKDHGFHRRGHVLVWPSWRNLPQSINDMADQADAATAIPPLVIDHIDEITQATEGLVEEWDVINEPYTNHDLMDLSGDHVMVEWFQAARAISPRPPCISTTTTSSAITAKM